MIADYNTLWQSVPLPGTCIRHDGGHEIFMNSVSQWPGVSQRKDPAVACGLVKQRATINSRRFHFRFELFCTTLRLPHETKEQFFFSQGVLQCLHNRMAQSMVTLPSETVFVECRAFVFFFDIQLNRWSEAAEPNVYSRIQLLCSRPPGSSGLYRIFGRLESSGMVRWTTNRLICTCWWV